MAKLWLITGSGNGLGSDIADAVLSAGDSAVAGARHLHDLDALVARYGSRIRPVPLEVRPPAPAQAAVDTAASASGRLDVLVNNAGYSQFAPFEQMSPEDFHAIVDTCFYGVLHTTRAALPVMRAQRSGHIVQASSIGGRIAIRGNSPYHAAKWAVGGFSDSVGMEAAPFGVKICPLDPGGIRTNWAHRARANTSTLLPDYEPSVGAILELLRSVSGHSDARPASHRGAHRATQPPRHRPQPSYPWRRCREARGAG